MSCASAKPVAAPAFAQIEPVGQCNLRCQMCAIQFRRDGAPHGPLAFMEFDRYCALLEQMPTLRELHLQGLGEPLMHPRFFDMVAHAVARGIRVTTNTNLMLLSGRRAELCLHSGLAELHVSLDAASAAVYERIRVRASLERVLNNLRRLLALRAESGRAQPRVHIIMVIMRQNLDELPELVRLTHELGADALSVQHLCHDFAESALPEQYRPMRDFVDGESLLAEDAGRIRTVFAAARRRAQDLGVPLRLPGLDRPRPAVPRSAPRCDWPWRGPYISYRGEVMPCCMVGTPDRACVGHTALESFGAVWEGAAYDVFRDGLLNDRPPEVCSSCAIYNGTF
ncbi:MAG TPA: radical SAM protein [Gammaproteobacteria bacterium]